MRGFTTVPTKPISFDIETRGVSMLKEFRVACDSTDVTRHFFCPLEYVEQLTYEIDNGHPIAGHNIVAFDIAKLAHEEFKDRRRSRLLRALWDKPGSILDTYVASKFMRGRVMGNSMDDWVKYLKEAGNTRVEPKVVIEDWDNATDQELCDRVTVDVINQEEITEWFLDEYGEGFKHLPCYEQLHPFFLFYAEGLARGIVVDEQRRGSTLGSLNSSIARKEREIYRTFGSINPNSNTQIDKFLKKKYGEGLPLGKETQKTKKRNPLLNKDNKFKVAGRFPETELIYDWREWDQQRQFLREDTGKSFFMKGAYKDGRVYPSGSPFAQPLLRSHYTRPMMNQAMRKVRRVAHDDRFHWIGCDIVSLEWSIFAWILASPPYNNPSILPEVQGDICPKQKTIDAFIDFFPYFPEDKWRDMAKKLNYAIIYSQQDPASLYFFGADDKRLKEFREAKDGRFPGFKELEYDLSRQYDKGRLRNPYGILVPVQRHALVNGIIQSTGAMYSYMIGIVLAKIEEEYSFCSTCPS